MPIDLPRGLGFKTNDVDERRIRIVTMHNCEDRVNGAFPVDAPNVPDRRQYHKLSSVT